MHIKDLQVNDSILMRKGYSWFWYECKFLSYDKNTQTVSGEITNSPNLDKKEIGTVIEANVEKCGLYINDKKDISTFAIDGTLWEDAGVLGKSIKHPSFGKISVSRVNSSNSVTLFGSDIKVRDFVELNINKAHLFRNLNSDDIFEEDNLISVYLTPTQWGELLSSFNTSGVPCTINWTEKEGYTGKFPFINKATGFENEMSLLLHKTFKQYESYKQILEDICNKKSLNNEDKKKLQEIYEMFHKFIKNSIYFINRQWKENIDKMVSDADIIFTERVRTKLQELGLEKVNEVINGILEEKKDVKNLILDE